MEREYFILIMMTNVKEKNMKVIIKIIKEKEMELNVGLMVIDMKVISKMD